MFVEGSDDMTQNKRILINVLASYGRSLLSIACGLFSTRWVLMALGKTDLGLYGVVGGLALFVTFVNIQFSLAISRYFAYSIGQAKVAENKSGGLEECRRWFNIAVSIHTILPLVLVVIGYPIGAYAITHKWLVIPPDRVEACVWVWRFTCISSLMGMMNVPFQGMYTAKQYIAELTIYNVLQTVVRTSFIYFMVMHPGDWLARYAFGMMVIATIPAFVICVRAMQLFPECRIVGRYLWSWDRFKDVVSYVTWQVFGSGGYVLRNSGVAILVNKMMGPNVNAAMSIGNTLSAETAVLTGALNGAFAPVITSACGEKNLNYMREMAFRSCKFGLLLTLIFALPLAIEVNEVLRLWLKEPPPFTSELCLCLIACVVIEKATMGHMMAVNASGVIAKFQCLHGFCLMLALPVGVLSLLVVRSAWSVGIALVGTMVVTALCDVWVARYSVGMSAWEWMKSVVIPLGVLSITGSAVGILPSIFMRPSFFRIVITTIVTLSVFCPLVWYFVLSMDERMFLRNKMRSICCR
jgi:O-antigen/teichoic acid export membrane protein